MGKRELAVSVPEVVPGCPHSPVWITALCGAATGQIKLYPFYPRVKPVFPRRYPPEGVVAPRLVEKPVENVGIIAKKWPQ